MMTSTTSFMSYFLFVFALLTALVSASPIDLKRDVFVPPITYPKAGTVWKVGEKHNVTWSLDDVPAQITNQQGEIVLAQGAYDPLAQGFDITLAASSYSSNVTTGDDYALVCDPNFTITN
ncbi:hypothetical protein BC629DRAFT_1531853 [Irpex lacteus]|nr:hypothetical protein BC629DRAFT_1531853 [Irpex lacteus]